MSIEPDDIPAAQLRTMQIIAGAMIWGVLTALAIFLFLALAQQHKSILVQAEDLHVVSLVAILLLLSNAPLALVLPGILTRNSLRQIASGAQPLDQLLPLRQTTMIVSFALLEGAAMLGCIAFFLETHAATLVVVGLAVLLMLAQFPTRQRVRTWLARQLATLEELRISGRT
jgi:hypothetical protein